MYIWEVTAKNREDSGKVQTPFFNKIGTFVHNVGPKFIFVKNCLLDRKSQTLVAI